MGLFNKDENWWLRLSIVFVAILSLSLLASINRTVSNQMESQQKQVDSLRDELFNEKSYSGRLELTLEHFIEIKKLDSTEVEDYKNNETE